MKDEAKKIAEGKILGTGFLKATFSGGKTSPWKKVRIRSILIENQKCLQFSYFDGQKDISKNFKDSENTEKVVEILNFDFQKAYIETTSEEIQIDGAKIKTRAKKTVITGDRIASNTPQAILPHNRIKESILDPKKTYEFLKAVDIQTQDGRIKSDMQSKFTQINEFLKIIDQTIDNKSFKSPINIVDLGCGSGYLTFALYYYFNEILKIETNITGIDLKEEVISKLNTKSNQLGWDKLTFIAGKIADFKSDQKIDIVVALHACDTATDDALKKAMEWGSKYIFSSPCCHHDLQTQLKKDKALTFNPILEQGIFKERLGDILTDTFRVLVLESKGYKTQVIEFVSPEHTNRNLMIKAVKSSSINFEALSKYQRLKKYWQVSPYIEKVFA